MATVKKTLDLTDADILAVLQEAVSAGSSGEDPPGAMTSRELCKALGCSIERTRRMIRELKESGVELELCDVIREDIWGKPYKTKAFRLKPDDVG